jgi:DNA-3-methyladenine glycosylase
MELEEGRIIPEEWYKQDNLLVMTRRLLGCKLVSNKNDGYTSGIITEVEAYDGVEDAACHAFGGRKTKKLEVLYQAGGIAYVYICYGIHHLINVVIAGEGVPKVILIRALEPIDGIELMQERRWTTVFKQLCKGPGALTAALGIDMKDNYGSLTNGPLRIEAGKKIRNDEIAVGPRIGIAEGKDHDLPYRFWIRESKFVSAHRKEIAKV